MNDKNVYSDSMFESELAQYYDAMRQFRDYGKEARFADRLIQEQCPGTVKILDIACGTGEHALKMTELGYDVTGIDLSGDMLKIARSKAEKAGVSIDFRQADINEYEVPGKFMAAYCLGYTFLYMTTHEKATDFLNAVNRALLPGGIFVLDFINGWSIADEWKQDKTTYRFEEATIFLSEQASLDRKRRIKHLEFQYLIDEHDGKVKTVAAAEDLRIFFEDEVSLLMSACGFGEIRSYGDYKTENEERDVPYIVIMTGLKKG